MITGGAGFIGSNYVRYVLEEPSRLSHPQCLINSRMPAILAACATSPRKFQSRYSFVRGDICDAEDRDCNDSGSSY
ncbi:MAG: GDP-mannose 4,6-dehydratase [Anaerolineae bacterium]